MSISPSALVHKDAQIGKDVHIDPFATIAKDVIIGDGTWIASHAIIMSGSRIGANCRIYPGAIVGGSPQDLKYGGEKTTVELEDGVTVREYCTINKGTKASGRTLIRKNALIMAYAHIAHDCVIDDHAIVANAVNLAGHVHVGYRAIVGGMSAVHQFVSIGRFSFIGGGTLVRKDVPPFIKAAREPLCFVGINSIGLKRHGFDLKTINSIKSIYRILFVRHDNIRLAVKEIESSIAESDQKVEILEFIRQSSRGLLRGFKQSGTDAY